MRMLYRQELTPFIEEFAAHHCGVRLGRMFGRPAVYVGRRLCACLMDAGVIIRLPDDLARRELHGGAKPFSKRGKATGSWVLYTPKTAAAARRLTPILEIAARHVARRQAEELTGVKFTGGE